MKNRRKLIEPSDVLPGETIPCPEPHAIEPDPTPAIRPVGAEDDSFLFRLFSSVKGSELGALQLDGAVWHQLMQMQFHAHEQHYRNMGRVDDDLILIGGEAVGRMIVLRDNGAMHLADISLLPEQRGLGIGTTLLRRLQDEARGKGCPLRLRVDPAGRAAHLYLRMGFAFADDSLPYRLMEWIPGRE